MQKTLHKLFDDFITECEFSARLRPETIRGHKEIFRHFTVLMPEVDLASKITTEKISEFFKQLQTRKRIVGRNTIKIGIRNSTVRAYHNRLTLFFKWLVSKNLLEFNPLEKVKPPIAIYNDQRALEKQDIQRIISIITLYSVNTIIFKRDLAMLGLFIFCGLRKNELLSLHVSDIDLENRVLTVRGETSKSKKTRQIPINHTLRIYLTEYLSQLRKHCYKSEYLIVSTTTKRGLTKDGLKHWVSRLNHLSGVKFHVHRFRHTFACNLAKQNVSAIKIQRLMGHADLRMTMVYLRSLNVEDFRDDVNKLCIADLM